MKMRRERGWGEAENENENELVLVPKRQGHLHNRLPRKRNRDRLPTLTVNLQHPGGGCVTWDFNAATAASFRYSSL